MTTELEWREKWLPDLRACPWHPLEINGSQFVIKWFFTACSYEIIITDFASFWYEEVKDDSLTDRVKKLNPSLDVCMIQVLEHIENALEKTLQNAVLNISLEPIRDGIKHDIMLSFTSQWIGKPFIWKFYCSLQDSRISSNHMIIPLMVMVSELQRRQKELIKIIQNKDREIQEYTPQEPVPVKNNLKTEPFVETAFEMAMMTSREFVYELKNCRTNTFNASGQDLYRQVMAINAWTERSPDGELDSCMAEFFPEIDHREHILGFILDQKDGQSRVQSSEEV
ncbi:hypothetical protein ACJMK2_021923 [Sinanodonta woodiana]|uniref:Non-homologous end-joining factor 1 n=1 Tax=Sinanodonta woodiana TaxID=1069815 RepID=A0ABD3THM1_SINWO